MVRRGRAGGANASRRVEVDGDGLRRRPLGALCRQQQPRRRAVPLVRGLRAGFRRRRHRLLHECLGAGGGAGNFRPGRLGRHRRGRAASARRRRRVRARRERPRLVAVRHVRGGNAVSRHGEPVDVLELRRTTRRRRSPRRATSRRRRGTKAARSGRLGLLATGGGKSILFARPPWQDVAGFPPTTPATCPTSPSPAPPTRRTSSCKGTRPARSGSCRVGTSASSPAFAGIAALLAQKAGGAARKPEPAPLRGRSRAVRRGRRVGARAARGRLARLPRRHDRQQFGPRASRATPPAPVTTPQPASARSTPRRSRPRCRLRRRARRTSPSGRIPPRRSFRRAAASS